MMRVDIPGELHLCQSTLSEASWWARMGEWGLCGMALTKAYRQIQEAAKSLDMDLETEARKLEAEQGAL